MQASPPSRRQVPVQGSAVQGVTESDRCLRVVRRPGDPPGGEQTIERLGGRPTPPTRPATDSGTGSPITLSASARTRVSAGSSASPGHDGGLQAARYRKVPVKREQPLLRYLPKESADIERMAAGMVTKSLSRSGCQRHARVTGHLEHILGCEAAQYHSAAPGVFNAEAVPTVVAPGIRSRSRASPLRRVQAVGPRLARPGETPGLPSGNPPRSPPLARGSSVSPNQSSSAKPAAKGQSVPVIPICLVTQNERSAALSSAAILSKEPRPASSAVIFAIRAVFPRSRLPFYPNQAGTLAGGLGDGAPRRGNFHRPRPTCHSPTADNEIIVARVVNFQRAEVLGTPSAFVLTPKMTQLDAAK